jgi:hypothetical protein
VRVNRPATFGLLGLLHLACSGPAPGTEVSLGHPTTVAPPSTASASASALASVVPTASSTSEPGASTPGTPVPGGPDQVLHLVLSVPYPDTRAYPVANGAVLVGRSLVVQVVGKEARQDPAWLVGMPEIINWDVMLSLRVPRLASPALGSLPTGSLIGMHAGNRFGPDEDRIWTGAEWSAKLHRDARWDALQPKGKWPYATVELPSGHLVAAVQATGGTDVRLVAPKSTRLTVSRVKHDDVEFLRGALAGNGPDDLRLCLAQGELFALRGGAWVAEEPPEGEIKACAVTASGTLWVVSDSGRGTVSRRTAQGWEPVALPPKRDAKDVVASGERVWIAAEVSSDYEIYSTEPIGAPIVVEREQLPGDVYYGISNLEDAPLDFPSVSAAPGAPGSRACSSPVIYFGPSLSDDIRRALPRHPETAQLALLVAEGASPGKLVVPGSTSQTKLVPSTKHRPVVVAIPPSWEQGRAAVAVMRKDVAKDGPSLLCGVPRNPRKLPPDGTIPP